MQREALPRGECRRGEVVGKKYVLERVIGAGGMGTVVAATDTLLNRRVAIKFLLPAVAERPDAVRRFFREARAAAGLQSEHVVRVIDVGTSESGAPYMVMEFLAGQDLAQYLREMPRVSVGDAVDLLLQAGEAVAEAHAVGIVHRDLKPSNLFVTSDLDGRRKVKVLDFGISRFIGLSAGRDEGAVTRTGDLLGSPKYMSPEQLRDAKHVTARADIWAFGVILYEVLTGHSPFDADTMTGVCARIVGESPARVRATRPDTPNELEQVIFACLEKDESRRIQTMGELARRLVPFASDLRPAQRIAALDARDSRIAVSPAGWPLADLVDTDGPTIVAPSGVESRPRRAPATLREHARLGLAAIALFGGASVVGVLLCAPEPRPEGAAAPADDTRLAQSAAVSSNSTLHEESVAPPLPAAPFPSGPLAVAASASARAGRPTVGSSAATHAMAGVVAPRASASTAPSASASHPTIDQALNSRR